MGKKDEYFTTMESEIKKWDAEVDKLNAKGNQMSADVRVEYDKQVKAMRADRDLAYSKLQEMRTANESAWQHMQSGVDAAWTSMKNALTKASSQYKELCPGKSHSWDSLVRLAGLLVPAAARWRIVVSRPGDPATTLNSLCRRARTAAVCRVAAWSSLSRNC